MTWLLERLVLYFWCHFDQREQILFQFCVLKQLARSFILRSKQVGFIVHHMSTIHPKDVYVGRYIICFRLLSKVYKILFRIFIFHTVAVICRISTILYHITGRPPSMHL
jgi:hypothetical protein